MPANTDAEPTTAQFTSANRGNCSLSYSLMTVNNSLRLPFKHFFVVNGQYYLVCSFLCIIVCNIMYF